MAIFIDCEKVSVQKLQILGEWVFPLHLAVVRDHLSPLPRFAATHDCYSYLSRCAPVTTAAIHISPACHCHHSCHSYLSPVVHSHRSTIVTSLNLLQSSYGTKAITATTLPFSPKIVPIGLTDSHGVSVIFGGSRTSLATLCFWYKSGDSTSIDNCGVFKSSFQFPKGGYGTITMVGVL